MKKPTPLRDLMATKEAAKTRPESAMVKNGRPTSAITDTARMYGQFKVPRKMSGLFGSQPKKK